MKRIICLLVMLLISLATVSAYGMGVITGTDYGTLRKGESVSMPFKFYPIDAYYDEEGRHLRDSIFTVSIYAQGENAELFTVTEPTMVVPSNTYSNTDVTVTIPKNMKKGTYEGSICAVGIDVVPTNPIDVVTTGISINVGACNKVHFEVSQKKK